MEMASALAGVLEFFFCGERKSRMLGQNPQSKAKINHKRNPHMEPGPNRTQATLMGVKHSHHCAIPAPQNKDNQDKNSRETS